MRLVGAIIGVLSAFGVALASSWTVGLNPGSRGQAQSATFGSITISAATAPGSVNLLYPGASGDVVISISNANPYPVTITSVDLPSNTTYATAYTTSALTVPVSGCTSSSPSTVTWHHSTASAASSHTLTTPLTVAASGQANNPLIVTLTNAAFMDHTAPAACAGTYFAMPALAGITAIESTDTATTSPATTYWAT